MKGDYEEFRGFVRRENKANSKPNKANLKQNEGFFLMAQKIATALRAS